MVITVEKIREGFETMKSELDDMKVNIDAEKEIEREAFEKALNEKYAEKEERIEKMLSVIVYTEEVEIPDPVVETETEVENANQDVVA